jgi:eukaryotic-like serine/threonine-protein kinase
VPSQRIQKRQALAPQTLGGRRDASGVATRPARGLRQQLLWLVLIPLAAVGVWAGRTIHTAIARSVADELTLVLAAEVELAEALLGAPDGVLEPSRAGISPFAARFAQALTRLPVLSRVGHTGETFAFDRNAVMLTPSRFEAELRAANLFSERGLLELRDPGGRVSAGYRPEQPRGKQPLTRMALAALSGRDGVDVVGYRDFRGVQVVGAWRWLPQYGLGVAVEIDADEAFALNDGLWRALIAVYVAMAFALLAVGGSTRIYQAARTQVAVAEQLGQYTLVRELGRGGMGTVYEARHALLRRPTAIKLMTPTLGDPAAETEAMLRFEREVQLTSQLSHPNTVTIYDYGRSEGGVFYYAMEYIDGVDLDRLVRLDGPLPAGRVIHLALQICGSLSEAHDKALVHRDIKPANVLVCERGGLPDTIKVLDFGLVKSLMGPQVSAAHVLVGTPQFMAPEVLRTPSAADARSDIYALGAVLYWLCTGHTIFEGSNALAAMSASAKLTLPSTLQRDVPVDLERTILRCLAREPMERPLSMAELATELRACRAYGSWSTQDARRYWRERGDALVRQLPAAPDVPTLAAH